MVPPAEIIAQEFGQLAGRMRSFRTPLELSVRRVLIPSITENFLVGGRPEWAPLSDETLKRREREGTLSGSANAILVESGRMMRAATARARWTITSTTATYGGFPRSAAYAPLHQGGSDEYNVKFPARPFAVIQPEDRVAVDRIFKEWMDDAVLAPWARRNRLR